MRCLLSLDSNFCSCKFMDYFD